MAAKYDVGSLIYRLVADVGNFRTGMITSAREMAELDKVTKETGNTLHGLVKRDFEQLRRLSRDLAHGLDTASKRFGQLTAESKAAHRTGQQYVQTLRDQAREIRSVKGRALTDIERQRVVQLERTADAFEESMAVERKALAEQKRAARARKRFLEQEKQAAMESSRAAQMSAKEKAAAWRLQYQRLQDFQRRQRAVMKQTADEQAAQVRRANQIVQGQLSPQRRLLQQMRELREAYRRGAIATREYEQTQRRLSRSLREVRAAAHAATQANNQGAQRATVLQRAFGGLARQLAFVTIAWKGMDLAARAWRKTMDLERFEKQLEIFTGSEDAAGRLRFELQALAAQTAMTTSTAMQSARTLLQYGVSLDQVVPMVKALGDVSGGETESMQRLALAMGQITANGRLQGQELRQLIEAGFNPLQTRSERTGESMLSLRDKMADAAISAKMVTEDLIDATSEGGRFADALKKIGDDTTFGKWNRFVGQVELMATKIINTNKGIVDELLDGWTIMISAMNKQSAFEKARQVATMEEMKLFNKMVDDARPMMGGMPNMSKVREEWAAVVLYAARRRDKEAEITAEIEKQEKARVEAQKMAFQTMSGSTSEVLDKYREELKELRMTERQIEDEKLMALTEGDAEFRATKVMELEFLRKEIDMIKQRNEDEEESLKLAKERAKAAQKIIDAMTKSDPRAELQAGARQARELELSGDLTKEQADARVQMLTKEFIDAKVEELKENEMEAAKVALKGSKEEFQLIAKIAKGDGGKAKREEAARQKAILDATRAVEQAVQDLPGNIDEILAQVIVGTV